VSACQTLVGAACHLLGQCRELVGGLSDAYFVAPSARLGGGTIGQHLRHTLDHYRAIVGANGLIDYDHRERDVPMESDRAEALRVIDAMHERLHALGAGSDAVPVAVRVMVSGDGTELQLSSTLGRELAFATHHAVHHQAMMRSIALELGAAVDPHFGRAPSTIHFERRRPG
jgi:uncharacterized damage-inducible protein DinB